MSFHKKDWLTLAGILGAGALTGGAALGAFAPEIAGGAALGEGMAAGEGLGMLGGMAPEITGIGGGELLGGAGIGSELFGAGASGFGPEMGLASQLLSPYGAPSMSIAGLTAPSSFAPGAVTAMPGAAASMFGPEAVWRGAEAGGMNYDKMMQLASKMTGMGGQQQQQRPFGAPQEMGNPMQRQAMMTQEEITKKWLLRNDPNTYARIYGQAGMGA